MEAERHGGDAAVVARAGGRVSLVGAGPGDPALLTLRAARLLAAADVVAYDALVPAALVAMAGPRAELLAVGRRAHGAPADYRLHPDVLLRARAGLHVVRLKAGDPLVFGRGGEEAEELALAGIPFEIVPGVSAALGAAACAGIPLTHRDHASDVVFATGHGKSGGAGCGAGCDGVAWDHVAGGRGTVVLYMSIRQLGANLRRLVDGGRRPDTPAAYVAAASTADQRVIVATLATLADATRDVDRAAPALVIVGDVVALRAKLAWLERRPLFGRRLVVGRARLGPSRVAEALASLGAEVWEIPTVDVAPPASLAPLDGALREMDRYAAVVFASAEAVDAVIRHLAEIDRDVRDLARVPLVPLGPAAAERLRAAGFRASHVARGACVEALGEVAALLKPGPWLVLGGDDGRASLFDDLTGLGVAVSYVGAYRSVYAYPRVTVPRVDAVVLPSSSAARLVLDGPLASALRGAPAVVIGPKTEAAARALGATDVTRAQDDGTASLVDAVVTRLGAAGREGGAT